MNQRKGWSRSWSACLFLGGLLAIAGLSASCGKSGLSLEPQSNLGVLGFDLSSADSVHNPPGPHPRPPALTAQFVDADATPGGSTGNSRWLVGNTGPRPLAVSWTVTGDSSWSTLPVQGSLTVARRSTASLTVPIHVPPSTPAGTYPLLLTVQSTSGSDAASASGFISVPGESLTVR